MTEWVELNNAALDTGEFIQETGTHLTDAEKTTICENSPL